MYMYTLYFYLFILKLIFNFKQFNNKLEKIYVLIYNLLNNALEENLCSYVNYSQLNPFLIVLK